METIEDKRRANTMIAKSKHTFPRVQSITPQSAINNAPEIDI